MSYLNSITEWFSPTPPPPPPPPKSQWEDFLKGASNLSGESYKQFKQFATLLYQYFQTADFSDIQPLLNQLEKLKPANAPREAWIYGVLGLILGFAPYYVYTRLTTRSGRQLLWRTYQEEWAKEKKTLKTKAGLRFKFRILKLLSFRVRREIGKYREALKKAMDVVVKLYRCYVHNNILDNADIKNQVEKNQNKLDADLKEIDDELEKVGDEKDPKHQKLQAERNELSQRTWTYENLFKKSYFITGFNYKKNNIDSLIILLDIIGKSPGYRNDKKGKCQSEEKQFGDLGIDGHLYKMYKYARLIGDDYLLSKMNELCKKYKMVINQIYGDKPMGDDEDNDCRVWENEFSSQERDYKKAQAEKKSFMKRFIGYFKKPKVEKKASEEEEEEEEEEESATY